MGEERSTITFSPWVASFARLILYSGKCDDHTCIHIYFSVYPQLPPVIEAPWGCCGHASESYFPRPLGFGGCATHATPYPGPGYSYFRMCLEKSGRNCLTIYLCVLFCVFFPFILDITFVGRTSRGHTGYFIHRPPAVRALIFLARRIQPSLSLVDREVEFCVIL